MTRFPAEQDYESALVVARRAAGFRGLGFGVKEIAGKVTGEPAWRVYVARKDGLRALAPSERVPARILDLPTDVIEYAGVTPSAARPSAGADRRHSLSDGSAIANHKGVPGTLGCLARLRSSQEPVLLSNYHILFARNSQRGDPVWHVPAEGSGEPYPIGRVLGGKVGRVSDRGEEVFVDAALGTIDDALQDEWMESNETPAIEPDTGLASAVAGSRVRKVGAATGRTCGLVVDVRYPDRWYWQYRSESAPRQILVQSGEPDGGVFSRSGDSGAVVRDECGAAVGLLWGSNARGEGVACPMGAVTRALGIYFDVANGEVS